MGEALTAAETISDEYARARALAALAPPQLPGRARGCWASQLSAAQNISSEDARAGALATLAPQLPEDERARGLSEALSATQKHQQRGRAHEGVGGAGAPAARQLLGEALTAAETISDDERRAEALAALAPQLPEDERARVWGEALSAAQNISSEDARARALAALAPSCPRTSARACGARR